MAAFAAGDLDAFGQLVGRYRDAIVHFCRQMTPDWHAAEDAAQETFVGLFRCRERYTPTAPCRALLYRLARNACIDAARRRRPAEEAPTESADPRPPPAATAVARAEAAAVRCALGRITALQREVLVLAHFQGLTYTEIAGALGVPVGTVCSRAAAGYRALRRALGG